MQIKQNHIAITGITLTFAIIIFLVISGLGIDSPTGQAVKEETREIGDTYAHNLNHHVTRFFGVWALDFPTGECGDTIKQLYGHFAHRPLELTSGYKTTGPTRIASINFGIETIEGYGTIDMLKGSLLCEEGEDSIISLQAENIIRIPKKERSTFFTMDLHGNSDGLLTVTHGAFSTPSLDCEFATDKNRKTTCNCKTHKISGVTG